MGKLGEFLKKKAKKLAETRVGRAVKKVPAPIRKGWLAGAMVPVPGAAEVGALGGAAVWGKHAVERAVRRRTGEPYRMFETPGSAVLREFMGVDDGRDPGKGSRASVKLDGVYARATREGVFSKSGKRLDVPRVEKRLGRYFRKHPAGELEGELWRKGEGLERIAGAVKSGGEATKRLRLHVFPKEGQKRPLPFGAVRRVAGKRVATAADVEKVYAKAVKRGHEGIVIRRPDGTAVKRKPREDGEWEVAAVPKSKRGVLVVKDGNASFKVQSRPGVAARPGDRVTVSYSGKTAKGKPRAAVAERVRNDQDFSMKTEDRRLKMMKTTQFETPATGILDGDPCARVGFARMTEEEELARDRRALKRIAMGATATGLVEATVIHKGRLQRAAAEAMPVPVAAEAVAAAGKTGPKVRAPGRVTVPGAVKGKKLGRGVIRRGMGMVRRKRFETPAQALGVIEFEGGEGRKRDGLSKARDAAILAGAGGVGIAGVTAARGVNRIVSAAEHAGVETMRGARRISREVTPQRVAQEGVKVIKRGVKKKVKEYFPTFVKMAKALKRPVGFETPAGRLGVIEFGTSGQLVDKYDKTYAGPLKVAAGIQKAYRRDDPAQRRVNLPIGDMQVIKSAYREAGKINKWGGRGGRLAKDAKDVVTGKPRERDASGRKKKREWEKSWAQEAGKKALITAGVLGYATGMAKSKRFRVANRLVFRKAKKIANQWVPNAFETPARALGVIEFAGKRVERREERKPDRTALKLGVVGGAIGAANGAVLGGLSTAHTKQADEYFDQVKLREARTKSGGVAVAGRREPKPFKRKGRFGRGERVARFLHETEQGSLRRLRRKVGKRALVGGLGGAAVLGGLAYAAGKARSGEKGRREFETPARALGVVEFAKAYVTSDFQTPARDILIELDEVAAEAGWDIRDPRGKSARVFAPGSRRRVRREKKWHEEVENERKLWKAGMGAALLGGGAAGLVLGANMPKKRPPVAGRQSVIAAALRRRRG